MGETSWKTLTPDFTSGKCDIAMGGISVTLERQKQVFFADKLDTDGKIPLVRCTDVKKYRTLEQINKPSVRLLEPAGGTNEAFVHAYLPKAKLTLTHDNMSIFQQLVDRKADVMITDASEALYQQKRYPKLCAVNPSKPDAVRREGLHAAARRSELETVCGSVAAPGQGDRRVSEDYRQVVGGKEVTR